MKTLIFALAAVLATGAATARAEDRPAELRDIQRLQQELENLDEDLQGLDTRDQPQARELRERADDIRDQATYLKVKIRRHGGDEVGTGVSLAEVDDLRHQVRDLRHDIVGGHTVASTAEVRVPAGTELTLRLEQPVSSETAQVEDQVRATVLRPVRVGSVVAIPAGTEVRGIVREAEAAERLRRAGRLQLEFDTLYVDHSRQDLRTRLVSLQQEEATRDTARKAGIGAIIGGVVGGLLKGRTGAVIGVMAGGGAVMAQKGEDVELPEGTVLKIRLDRPVTVPAVSVSAGDDRDYDDRDRKD
jgi:hypothetical protein